MRKLDRLIFQFRIRFDPAAIPCGLAERLEEKLRQWFIREGFDYGFGALGGSAVVYGEVGRRGADATLTDRNHLADWLKQQRLRCKVALGDLERESESNITREVTELVFHLDNLTDEEWREGEEYRSRIEERFRQKPK